MSSDTSIAIYSEQPRRRINKKEKRNPIVIVDYILEDKKAMLSEDELSIKKVILH